MEIHQAGSRPTRRAPKEYFTGTVWQDPVIQTEAPARLACNRVSFEPGARTAWPRAAPSGRSSLVTWYGFRRARSIGMARRPPTA